MFQAQIDIATAIPLEASNSGDALFDLGMMFASGRSGAIDLIAAHKWFNLAAVKGRMDALLLRREVAELMSDADIAAAQRDARAWMTAH